MSIVLGTALVRIQPSMAGFGAALTSGLGAQGAAMQRAGAAASLLITAPIVGAVAVGVKAAVSFETAFAGVRKTVDATEDQFEKLESGIVNMANKMPFAREEIAAVVEAAGRFGVATEDLLSFSEVALQLGAATNLGATQAAEQLTRLANIMELPADQFDNLGAAIVALGNDFPTTEGEIAKFTQRLAGAASVIGASSADILGLSAGMASLGIRSEAGGTAMSRVMLTMHSAILTGGEDLKQFADIAGVSSDQFAAAFAKDPTYAILQFIGGVRKLNDEGKNTPAILKEMGLGEIRVRDMLLRAASGFDTMAGAVVTARDGFEEGTALQEEYAKRVATTASQWTIFKNNVSNVAMILGQSLLPVLNSGMEILKPMVEVIRLLSEGFALLPGPLQAVVGFLVLLVAAAGPLAVIIPRLVQSIALLRTGMALFGGSIVQLLATHPVLFIFLIVAALAVAVYMIVTHWETIKAKTDEALYWMGEQINWFIDNPLAAIIEGWMALPEMAGWAWTGVVGWMKWAWEQIKELCSQIKAAIEDALGPIGKLAGWVGDKAGNGFQGLTHFGSGGEVGGPRGTPQLVVAHAGETVLPTHKQPLSDFVGQAASSGGGIVVQGPLVAVSGVVIRDDRDITLLARDLRRELEQAAKAKGIPFDGLLTRAPA